LPDGRPAPAIEEVPVIHCVLHDSGDAAAVPVAGFGIELHGDHDTIMRASKAAKEYLQWASERHRVECALKELWVSTKCGESDTTSGCGANPTVGDAFDKLYAAGCTLVFGETTELTGGDRSSPRAAATTRCGPNSWRCSTATRTWSTGTRPRTCPIRSRPRVTSPAA
jgi:altronate dehydratase